MPFDRRVVRRFVPLVAIATVAAIVPATMASGEGGTWDLAHPTATMTQTNILGGAARGIVVDVTTDTPVSALGIDARFAAETTLTVEVREVVGRTAAAEPVASASTAVPGGELGFHDVPIDVTFLAGHRYDVRFQLPGGWGTSNLLRYQAWDNTEFFLEDRFAAGPFLVVDGAGGFSSYSYDHRNLPHVHVVAGAADTAGPTLAVRVADGDDVAGGGWYNAASSGHDGVVVDVVATDDSAVARVQCDDGATTVLDVADRSAASIVLGDGFHSVTCSAWDVHGNRGLSEAALRLRVDQTPPSLAPRVQPNPVYEGQSATALPGATDAFGIADAGCDPVTTKVPGPHSVTCRAADVAGNAAAATVAYDVLYAFDGFFAPVRMDGENRVKAGSSVPLKFSLDGFRGLDVLAAGSPEVRPCGATSPVWAADGKLSYDADGDVYTFVWRTDRAWAGGCYDVTVRLDDGSAKSVSFTMR